MHWRCRLFGHLFRDITEESPPELVDPPAWTGRKPRVSFNLRPSPLWQWAQEPKMVECVRCGTRAWVTYGRVYVENLAGEFDYLGIEHEVTVLGINTRHARRKQRRLARQAHHLILGERARAAQKQKREHRLILDERVRTAQKQKHKEMEHE